MYTYFSIARAAWTGFYAAPLAGVALALVLAMPAASANEQTAAGVDSALDSDSDGISDANEINQFGTDHRVADTDSDGLLDGEEVYQRQTDPNRWDTDGDTLGDGEEVMVSFSDPTLVDTDGDGLNDAVEVYQHGTSPVEADSDRGGIGDGPEVRAGTNPLVADDDLVVQSIR